MKKLKKITALILVLALVTSLASAATTIVFTDDDDIVYKEAVSVMVALGVINGYSDGSYDPEGDITRAEMAKLVSYIMNEGEDINDEYAGQNNFYDCGDWYWASGYIAYAEQQGVICGDGHGYFLPDDTVTGVEAAKMLLVALGYDADNEGYVGSSWSVNVISDARSADLNDGMSGFSWTSNLTRDEAAMMMLNALKATMVEYTSNGTTITTGDVSISIGSSAATGRYNDADDHYDDSDDDNETLEMCEEYFPDLKLLADDETDLLGRTACIWEFDGDEIGTYAESSDYTFFADDDVTPDDGDDMDDLLDLIQDLADDDLEFYEESLYEVAVYLNGDYVEKCSSTTNGCKTGYTDLDEVEIQLGDLVELYEDDDEIYKIVIVRYTYDVIDEIEDDDDIDDCTIETEDGYEMCFDDSINFASIYNVADEGDDLLIVVNDNDDIVYAEWPTILTGSITSVYTNNYLKMDGTTYYLTANVGTPNVTEDDEEAIIYLNQYSYVVYCDTTDNSNDDNAVAVIKAYSTLNSDSEIVDMVKVVYSDGTTGSMELGTVDNGSVYTPTSSYGVEVGGLYTYEEDDDVYDLTAAGKNATDATDLVLVDNYTADYADHDIFSSSARYYFDDSFTMYDGDGYDTISSMYYDNDVLFIFVDEDDKDVTVYQGVTSLSLDNIGDELEVMLALNEDMDRIVAVFVSGEADGETADEVIYIDGGKTGSTYINGETYYTYDAYLEGEEIDDFYADTSSANSDFYEYSIGDDGEYELDSLSSYVTSDDEEYAYAANLTIDQIVSTRYILFDGTSVGVFDTEDFNMSSAEIWDFATSDGKVTSASKLEDLWEDTQDSSSEYYNATIEVAVVGETESYTLTAIYITGITYSSVNTIASITDNSNDVVVTFDNTAETITITGAGQESYNLSTATITTTDGNATVSISGDVVTVTAADGSKKTYNVERYYGLTDGVKLTIELAGTNNTTSYKTTGDSSSTVSLDENLNVTTVSISSDNAYDTTYSWTITPNSGSVSTSYTDDSTYTLSADTTYTITVTITADDGTEVDYTYTFVTAAANGINPASELDTTDAVNGISSVDNTTPARTNTGGTSQPANPSTADVNDENDVNDKPVQVVTEEPADEKSSVTTGVALTFSAGTATATATTGSTTALTFTGTGAVAGSTLTLSSDGANSTSYSWAVKETYTYADDEGAEQTISQYVTKSSYTLPEAGTTVTIQVTITAEDGTTATYFYSFTTVAQPAQQTQQAQQTQMTGRR